MNKEMWKMLIEQKYKAGALKSVDNFSKYRQVVGTALMILIVVFIILGLWKYALFSFIILHFNASLSENWWQIKNLQHYVEQKLKDPKNIIIENDRSKN